MSIPIILSCYWFYNFEMFLRNSQFKLLDDSLQSLFHQFSSLMIKFQSGNIPPRGPDRRAGCVFRVAQRWKCWINFTGLDQCKTRQIYGTIWQILFFESAMNLCRAWKTVQEQLRDVIFHNLYYIVGFAALRQTDTNFFALQYILYVHYFGGRNSFSLLPTHFISHFWRR